MMPYVRAAYASITKSLSVSACSAQAFAGVLGRISSSRSRIRRSPGRNSRSVTGCNHVAVRLVEQNTAVREARRCFGAGGEQHAAADAACPRQIVAMSCGRTHRVVDREERRDVASRTVDVDVDVLVGVLRLEVDQLRAQEAGRSGRRFGVCKKMMLSSATGCRGRTPSPSRRLLDDVGHQIVHCVEVHVRAPSVSGSWGSGSS